MRVRNEVEQNKAFRFSVKPVTGTKNKTKTEFPHVNLEVFFSFTIEVYLFLSWWLPSPPISQSLQCIQRDGLCDISPFALFLDLYVAKTYAVCFTIFSHFQNPELFSCDASVVLHILVCPQSARVHRRE